MSKEVQVLTRLGFFVLKGGNEMTNTIVLENQKGGVGKITTAMSLGFDLV
ncbi:hypothetical protein MH117_04095 [Paenibacillus sp. ACRRX]|nr:hypothetical protein [Paenibacillus sp. ACRRX]MCG7406588.1 hypothetical protein [Paenibacillus sp. ACRRX]